MLFAYLVVLAFLFELCVVFESARRFGCVFCSNQRAARVRREDSSVSFYSKLRAARVRREDSDVC